MSTQTIPSDYNHVMPYLIVSNAEGLMQFMSAVLGATEKMKHLDDKGGVMHAEMKIGDSVIMISNATEQYPAEPAGMFVYVANADEAYRLGLQHGATSILEPADQPYGRSGGIKDPYGNTWWITHYIEQ